MLVPLHLILKPLLTNEVSEISNAAGVAPLIVVPGNNLNHVPAKSHRQESVYDRGAFVTTEVTGNERLFRVAEDTFERTFGSLFESLIHCFLCGFFTHVRHEIDRWSLVYE